MSDVDAAREGAPKVIVGVDVVAGSRKQSVVIHDVLLLRPLLGRPSYFAPLAGSVDWNIARIDGSGLAVG